MAKTPDPGYVNYGAPDPDPAPDPAPDSLSGDERSELEKLRAAHRDSQSGTKTPPDDEPAPLNTRLVLATGNTVEAVNANSTHHYDEVAGATVPVVSSYVVTPDDDA